MRRAPRTPEQGALGGLFSKKAILSLLSRTDAEFLRYYHARDNDGKRTLVLVAADANGNDLLDAGAQTLDQALAVSSVLPDRSQRTPRLARPRRCGAVSVARLPNYSASFIARGDA